MAKHNAYDEKYSSERYYWGKNPSRLSRRIVQIVRPSDDRRQTLLDLGCGEGRDAVWLAQHGFTVTGLDLSMAGLNKMREYAEQVGVEIQTIHGDFATHEFECTYDVIISVGAMHYLPLSQRQTALERYKDQTVPGGLNAISVFVDKPFLERAPDPQGDVQLYRSGQLMGYYWDWEILWCDERIVQCRSGGLLHQHAIADMVARKP